MFEGRVLTLCVTSGIACYKAVDLMRDLQRAGARVRPVLSDHAQEFVRPALFEALSGETVGTSMWEGGGDATADGDYARFPHLDFARGIDGVIVAPATANVVGKIAGGIADDLLTTTLLAVDPRDAPVIVAPTMNRSMYDHPAVSANIRVLRDRGYWVLTPDEGPLACGETGIGRWPGNEAIIAATDRAVNGSDRLAGRRVVVTAGPTQVDIDVARTLTNPSTGRMGFEIARAAWRHGADVTLVHGPTSLEPPPFLKAIAVRTVDEMSIAVFEALPGSDQLWMAAAVSDWAPEERPDGKLKKGTWDGTLRMRQTEDILARAAVECDPGTLIVGFAVETDDIESNARRKLDQKRCHYLVVNDPTEPGAGFAVETNRVDVYDSDGGRTPYDMMTKARLADRLVIDLGDRHAGTPTHR